MKTKIFKMLFGGLTGLLIMTSSAAEQALLTPSEGAGPAPQFQLTDMKGEQHTLSDYQNKVLVVNFWATWCPPCIKEMPALSRAAMALKADDIHILGINMGESREDIQAFTSVTPVDFPLLLDEDMAQGPNWQLKGLPTTYIVDPQGQVAYTVIGERDWDADEILAEIRALAKR